jgi:hypothetical protein
VSRHRHLYVSEFSRRGVLLKSAVIKGRVGEPVCFGPFHWRTRMVRLHSLHPCTIKIGVLPVADRDGMMLAANCTEHFGVKFRMWRRRRLSACFMPRTAR